MVTSDVNNCAKCFKNVGQRAKAVECFMCKRWLHIKCGSISAEEYELIKRQKNPTMVPVCEGCRKQVEVKSSSNLRDTEKEQIDEDSQLIDLSDVAGVNGAPSTTAASNELSITRGVSGSVESQSLDRPRIENDNWTVVRRIKKQTNDVCTAAESTRPEPLQSSTPPTNSKEGEVRGTRPPRDQCLIFFNIPESTSEKPEERVSFDSDQITLLIERMIDETDGPLKVRNLFRLGAKTTTNTSPRPLKVVLSTPASVRLLLSKGWKLKGLNVSMNPDLTTEERKLQKEAVAELHRRTANGEKDLKIVNFRVVRKRKLLFRPITITAQASRQGLSV